MIKYIIYLLLLGSLVAITINYFSRPVFYLSWPNKECVYTEVEGVKFDCPKDLKGYVFGGYVDESKNL